MFSKKEAKITLGIIWRSDKRENQCIGLIKIRQKKRRRRTIKPVIFVEGREKKTSSLIASPWLIFLSGKATIFNL